MPSERITSTMKSEPGRAMVLATPAALPCFSFSAPEDWATTVLAASVLPIAAAPFRKERRASLSMALPRLVDAFVQALVVQRPGHLRQLVAELALVRRHAVRVVRLARAPGLNHGEMVRPVGLLHHFVAHVAVGGAVRLAERLERHDRVLATGRDDVDVGDDHERAACRLELADGECVVEAVIGRRVAQILQLVAERLPRGRVAVERRLVLPGG